MNLESIDPEVIVARGRYATVNGELKSTMEGMQQLVQQACDALRHGLNADSEESMQDRFEFARKISLALFDMAPEVRALKEQKEIIWPLAWGKK